MLCRVSHLAGIRSASGLQCQYAWLPALGLTFSMGMDAHQPLARRPHRRPHAHRHPRLATTTSRNASASSTPGCSCSTPPCSACSSARDLLLFYLFFEFTLIPMFFIIGIWGGSDRRRAAGKFFLFTFAGSVLTLASLIYIAYLKSQTCSITTPLAPMSLCDPDLLQLAPSSSPSHRNTCCFLGLIAGFAVKVPLFPVHTWLPLAHTEAPTAGSRHPRRRAAQARHLRPAPLRPPRAPRRPPATSPPTIAVHLHHRHHLRGPGLLGPGRHEEAHRLLFRLPPRLLRPGHVRPHPARASPAPSSTCSTTASPPGPSSSSSA